MKVSIVVPVYNAAKYLEKCLDSLFGQTYKNIEVICINDGSTDNSLDILHKYKKKYGDLLIVETINNSGQAYARNLGIKKSNGDFIMFVDSDDILYHNALEVLCSKQIESNADIVTCDIERIFQGKFSGFVKKFQYDTKISMEGLTTIEKNPEIICFLTAAVYAKLIRKSFIVDNNINFLEGYIYEDFVFTQELLAKKPIIYITHEPFYKYYVRSNTTMTSKKSKVTDMFYDIDVVYDFYKENGLIDEFKEEFDFLCFYHLLVGTSFRMWNSHQYGLIKSIKLSKNHLKKFKCSKKNKYLEKKGLLFKIFVYIFA